MIISCFCRFRFRQHMNQISLVQNQMLPNIITLGKLLKPREENQKKLKYKPKNLFDIYANLPVRD